MVVEGWLERAAATAPERTAIETPQDSCSYAELLAAARAGAAALATRGATPGERVAIALPPGLDFAQALHACLLLGAVAVPVDLRLGAAERERVTAGAAVVVAESLVGAPSPESLVGAPSAEPLVGAPSLEPSIVPVVEGHELEDIAVTIHTSGTTSAPKPVELTYGNLLWSALGSAVALGLDPRERWLCALPVSHVGGLSILIRSAIYATTAVVHERFDTAQVLAVLREREITLVSLVATTLARLLDAGLEHPPALRCALTGGGPVPAALLRRAAAAGVPVGQTYGLTESCSQATTTPLPAIGHDPRAAGTPLFCTRLRLDGAAPARPGEAPPGGEPLVGEIVLSGPTIAPGSLAADGWFHTGDLGSLDERGRLRVTGRAAETIVSGGENVAPSEVEAVLEAHPGVLEAAAVGRPDPQWGEAVTAIVVARPGVQLAEEPLRAHCAASLAPYKVPKRIELAGGPLPRTRSGKLLRRELA